jgi:alpha-1,2-rhamnosyltransferase
VLAEAIERCDCLVCPSIAEGFGLPVVEGLMRGNQVFASDIEVFREVGGEHCRYFSLSDPTDLADQLEKWFIEKDRSPNAPRTDFQWPNWKQSAEELIATILATARGLRRVERKERRATSSASDGNSGAVDSGELTIDNDK